MDRFPGVNSDSSIACSPQAVEFIAFCSKEKAQYESQGQVLRWPGWARGCVLADGSVQSYTHTTHPHTHPAELTHSETHSEAQVSLPRYTWVCVHMGESACTQLTSHQIKCTRTGLLGDSLM